MKLPNKSTKIYLLHGFGKKIWKVKVRSINLHSMSEGITVTSIQVPTDRELELVKLLSLDMRSKTIAQQWKVSPRTVEAHILSVKKKFAVNTIYGLIALFYRNNLIE